MENLPLFPLNTVLFPGMPLQLHIFEERYKLMIADCMRNHSTFGVVRIKSGRESFGPLAEPYRVGCKAKITKIEKLNDGKMNLKTTGLERFKIISYFADKPYLNAEVETFPIRSFETEQVSRNNLKIKDYVHQYIKLLAQLENIEAVNQQLPLEPEKIAYFSAYILNVGSDEKQKLLEQPTIQDLQNLLFLLFRKEISLLKALHSTPDSETTFPFSNN